jgi:Fur family peroxide stress response transcriptional regulator
MKYSRQRKVIAEIVKESRNHPTAEEVYDEACREIPTIGLATVYRNLNFLADQGEIIKIRQPGGIERFDGRTEEHYHMVCPECGALTDIYAGKESIERVIEEIGQAFGINAGAFCLTDAFLEGLCIKCRYGKKDNKNRK